MFDSVATQLGRARDESARELLTYAATPHQQVLARSATVDLDLIRREAAAIAAITR